MPTRFESYRVRDGVTRLDERFLNRVFGDLDLRLAELEGLQISWESAVTELTAFGLARIDEALRVTFDGLTQREAEAQAIVDALSGKPGEAQAAIDAVQGTIDGAVDNLSTLVTTALHPVGTALTDMAAALEAVEAGLQDLQEALDSLPGGPTGPALPGYAPGDAGKVATINGTGDAIVWAALPTPPAVPDEVVTVVPPELGLNTLAAGTLADQLVMVEGHGIYRWDAASTEPADQETCIATAAGEGRWLLVAPAWDFTWAYLAPVLQDLQDQLDLVDAEAVGNALAIFTTLQAEVTALAARTLHATALLDFPSVSASNTQSLTVAVPGAAVGDAVLATPPATLASGLLPTCWVSAPDTVTVALRNTTGSAIDPAAATWRVTVFKPTP
jgi:hypothetical protein